MANTYTQINVHVVFAVKGRENVIHGELMDQICKYMHGILVNLKQFPLAIGGYKNHVHLFFELNPDTGLSDIVEKTKSNTSKWVNDHKMMMGHFEWQRGYGGFSYSRSQRNKVIKYIMRQEDHHKGKTFREEYMDILNKFEIDFDDKYVFEFYE